MINKLQEYLPLATLFVIATGLLTHHLGHWSFWFDESFTSTLIKFDFSEIADRTANDVHPPLYYYLLKVWSNIFGSTDAALRAFSSVLMLGATFSLYGLYRRIANRQVALLAMSFAVAGPFVLRYGQEARMYALAAMILSLATLVLHAQVNTSKRKRSNWMWYLYAVLVAAALYTHYFTFPIILAHWLYVIYADSKLEFNRKINFKKIMKTLKKLDRGWLKANALAFLLFLPWLPSFYDQATRVNGGFWIEKVNYTSFADTFAQMFMYDSFTKSQGPSRLVLGMVIMVVVVWMVYIVWQRSERAEKANLILLGGPALITSALLVAYSIPSFTSSIYSVRYLASFSVLLYTSMGYLVWLVWKNVSKQIAVGVALGLMAIMIGGTAQVVWGWGREHFTANKGIERLNQVLIEGDGVVTQGYWQQYDTAHYIRGGFTPQVKVEGNFYGGETLLIGNEEVIINDYALDAATRTGTIWYISDSNDTFDALPKNWRNAGILFFDRDFKITRMIVE